MPPRSILVAMFCLALPMSAAAQAKAADKPLIVPGEFVVPPLLDRFPDPAVKLKPVAQRIIPIAAEPDSDEDLAALSRDEVVALLADADYTARRRAQAYLMRDTKLTLDELRNFIQASDSIEQRNRLVRIAEHVKLRQIREREFGPNAKPIINADFAPNRFNMNGASLGFSYTPAPDTDATADNPNAVMVAATMPGFPAHQRLLPGDVILAIDQQRAIHRHRHMDVTSWIQMRISAHRPGDWTVFTLRRDGKIVEVIMACAEATALNNMYTTNLSLAASRNEPYDREWQQAHRKLLAGLPQPANLTPQP